MGGLLKESLFYRLCLQKVLFPPKAFPEPTEDLSSAQLSERCERITLVFWCHFCHCFTIKPPFGGPHCSLISFAPHSWKSAPTFHTRHTAPFLQAFSTWVFLSTPLPPAPMSIIYLQSGPYSSSIFSALPTIFSLDQLIRWALQTCKSRAAS